MSCQKENIADQVALKMQQDSGCAIPMWLCALFSLWPLDSFRGWVMHLYVALPLFLGRSNRRKHSSRAGLGIPLP